MTKNVAIITGYIMFYDLLDAEIGGNFFSKIERAIERAEDFVEMYPEDYNWEENDFEETLQSMFMN